MAGSDGLDFYTLSVYDKNPARLKEASLQAEIEMWQRGQREWQDASPNARVYFLVGNHEDRLRRHLWRNPQLFDLEVLRLPNLLGFEKLGIPWKKDAGERAHKELELFGRLVLKHGDIVRPKSAYTAAASLEREQYSRSIIHGHTHRGGAHYMTTRDGLVAAQEGFCLCLLEAEYIARPNWQQGLVLAEVSQELASIEAIPFYRTRGELVARWRGKEYRQAL